MQGPGIGVPFNVQHVAHIGADNVEALLLAAKDDPKLLPSFLLPEGRGDEKENRKKSVEIHDTKAGELMGCESITSYNNVLSKFIVTNPSFLRHLR